MSEQVPDPLELEGMPKNVDISAWEGTVQGEPYGGPGGEDLPPDVLEGHIDPAWEGTKVGFPEEQGFPDIDDAE